MLNFAVTILSMYIKYYKHNHREGWIEAGEIQVVNDAINSVFTLG